MQRPDPLTDPLPLDKDCRHPVVYIENRCCHHQQTPKPPVMRSSVPFVPPSLNGSAPVPQTQLLPVVRSGDGEGGEAPRHRFEDDDKDGTDMKDILLGCLIGAAVAIFVIGLLLILLVR